MKLFKLIWKIIKLPFTILTLIASIFVAPAAAKSAETQTVNKVTKPKKWSEGEITEVLIKEYGFKDPKEYEKLPERFKPDVYLDNFVIEIDFENKMYEALGQSLTYSFYSDYEPGIVILDDVNKNVNFHKFLNVFSHYNIKVWIVEYNDKDREILKVYEHN